MVTHSRTEAYDLCERIATMKSGEILTLKPTKELFADPGTITGAEITGCKNIAPAVKKGAYEVDVPAWGVCLKTELPVRDDVCAVGIRAHYFNVKAEQNRFAVKKQDEMEEPFELIVRFRYDMQMEGTQALWWRMPKDRKPPEMPTELGVSPRNVLPLYPDEKGITNE